MNVRKLITAILLVASSTTASAYSECLGTINNIWAGDSGNVQLTLSNGVLFVIFPNNPDTKNIYSMALLAKAMGSTVNIRFYANGVACSSASGLRTDVVGMYIF
jgi:hypothetical protein